MTEHLTVGLNNGILFECGGFPVIYEVQIQFYCFEMEQQLQRSWHISNDKNC